MAAQPINVTYNFRSGATSNIPASAANDLVPLHQLQEMLAGSIRSKESVKVAFHENQDISTGGFLTENGYTLVANDRFLLISQTNLEENGIYVVDNAGAWTRALDADEADELKANTSVYILEGEHQGRKYELLEDVTIVGTDPQSWNPVPVPANTAVNTSADSSVLVYSNSANVQDILNDFDDQMQVRSGVTAQTTNRLDSVTGTTLNHMGTFTGSALPDNADIKTLFQTVETGIDGLYSNLQGMKFTSLSDITIPNELWTTVAHNLSSSFPSSVQMFDAEDNYAHATQAFRWRPKRDGEGAIIPDAIEIYQDSGVNRLVKVVVQR